MATNFGSGNPVAIDCKLSKCAAVSKVECSKKSDIFTSDCILCQDSACSCPPDSGQKTCLVENMQPGGWATFGCDPIYRNCTFVAQHLAITIDTSCTIGSCTPNKPVPISPGSIPWQLLSWFIAVLIFPLVMVVGAYFAEKPLNVNATSHPNDTKTRLLSPMSGLVRLFLLGRNSEVEIEMVGCANLYTFFYFVCNQREELNELLPYLSLCSCARYRSFFLCLHFYCKIHY